MKMFERLMVLAFVLTSSSGRAEAGVVGEGGVAADFCGEASCGCGQSQCACGQVCSSQGCLPSQAGFCVNDDQCAATCGAFRCVRNACLAVPDGGLLVVIEPYPPYAIRSGNPSGGPLAPISGCSSTRGLALFALIALATLMRRRRPTPA